MIQKEGKGWRLARDISRTKFPILIGGEGWAVELTEKEWIDLASLIQALVDQHSKIINELMPEESICIELERGLWWGCLDGNKSAWNLRIILLDNDQLSRGVEGFWPVPAAEAFVHEVRIMWDSNH